MDERLTHRFWKDRSVVKNVKAFCSTFVLEVDIAHLDTVDLPVTQDIMKRFHYSIEVGEP